MIDIEPRDREILLDILRSNLEKQDKVYAFGSRVRGTAKPWSDLDLLIMMDEAPPLSRLYELMDKMEESELSIRIDLIDWSRIGPEFRTAIQDSMTRIDF